MDLPWQYADEFGKYLHAYRDQGLPNSSVQARNFSIGLALILDVLWPHSPLPPL